jgi:hypothetical protein
MSTADDLLFAPVGGTSSLMIPEPWLRVLHLVQDQPAWKGSVLAGGALRDLDNGRPVKDVDIFVPFLDNESALKKLEDVCSRLPEKPLVDPVEHNSVHCSKPGQPGINHFIFVHDGWKFEISQRTEQFDYKSLMCEFDVGLCMIALTPSDEIFRNDAYKKDKANHTLTIVNQTGGREMDHAERILRKYAGWTIIPF